MADNNQKTIDKRTFGRYVDKGLLKASDVEAHLKSLPDDTANATWVELDLEEAELSHSETDDELEDDVDLDSDVTLEPPVTTPEEGT